MTILAQNGRECQQHRLKIKTLNQADAEYSCPRDGSESKRRLRGKQKGSDKPIDQPPNNKTTDSE